MGDSFQTLANLPIQNLLHLVAIPFMERFADTKNGAKTGIQRRSDLPINDLIRFTEQSPSLTMSQNHIFNVECPEHRRTNFTGKRTTLLPVHILGTDSQRLGFSEARITAGIAVNGGTITTSTSFTFPISVRNDCK